MKKNLFIVLIAFLTFTIESSLVNRWKAIFNYPSIQQTRKLLNRTRRNSDTLPSLDNSDNKESTVTRLKKIYEEEKDKINTIENFDDFFNVMVGISVKASLPEGFSMYPTTRPNIPSVVPQLPISTFFPNI